MFHEFGKVGAENTPYFVRNESDWHDKKGLYYDMNKELPYMRVSERSLFLLQQAGIQLTQDEYIAISSLDKSETSASEFYRFNEPVLATVLRNAAVEARRIESKLVVVWP